MKIFASNQFSLVKSLKKTAKIATLTLPLMVGAESCSSLLFPPAPPHPFPHHYPHHYLHPRPIPHPHPFPYYRTYPFWGSLGTTPQKDTIQYNDVFELNKNDMAYIEQNKPQSI